MNPTWLRRLHATMVIVWLGLAVPGLTVWRESIWFVVAMSLYANMAAEFAAYQGARAETEQDD